MSNNKNRRAFLKLGLAGAVGGLFFGKKGIDAMSESKEMIIIMKQ